MGVETTLLGRVALVGAIVFTGASATGCVPAAPMALSSRPAPTPAPLDRIQTPTRVYTRAPVITPVAIATSELGAQTRETKITNPKTGGEISITFNPIAERLGIANLNIMTEAIKSFCRVFQCNVAQVNLINENLPGSELEATIIEPNGVVNIYFNSKAISNADPTATDQETLNRVMGHSMGHANIKYSPPEQIAQRPTVPLPDGTFLRPTVGFSFQIVDANNKVLRESKRTNEMMAENFASVVYANVYNLPYKSFNESYYNLSELGKIIMITGNDVADCYSLMQDSKFEAYIAKVFKVAKATPEQYWYYIELEKAVANAKGVELKKILDKFKIDLNYKKFDVPPKVGKLDKNNQPHYALNYRGEIYEL